MTLGMALSRARASTGQAEDWCVLRLDRSDQTLEIYWSEPNSPYYSTSAAQNLSSGTTRSWGGHAEMNMIRDFVNIVRLYGRMPTTVELYLSRSPCDRSPAFDVDGLQYPIGCGNKLSTLASRCPRIREWIIVYDEVFGGNRSNAAFSDGAHAMIAALNAHPRIVARRFNQFLDR